MTISPCAVVGVAAFLHFSTCIAARLLFLQRSQTRGCSRCSNDTDDATLRSTRPGLQREGDSDPRLRVTGTPVTCETKQGQAKAKPSHSKPQPHLSEEVTPLVLDKAGEETEVDKPTGGLGACGKTHISFCIALRLCLE